MFKSFKNNFAKMLTPITNITYSNMYMRCVNFKEKENDVHRIQLCIIQRNVKVFFFKNNIKNKF